MTVLYFAWVKEKVGISEEVVSLPEDVETVAALMDWLSTQSDKHKDAFENRKSIKAAVDQTHVDHSARIKDAKEVAFFPPVTGG